MNVVRFAPIGKRPAKHKRTDAYCPLCSSAATVNGVTWSNGLRMRVWVYCPACTFSGELETDAQPVEGLLLDE